MTRHDDGMETVLFVCVNNAGRSQIAEAVFNRLAAERNIAARAESAGTIGVGAVNSQVVKVMEEAGLSTEGLLPKQLTLPMTEGATRIIALERGAESGRSPVVFTATELWEIKDPAGQDFGTMRQIRDQITERVKLLLAEIAANPKPSEATL